MQDGHRRMEGLGIQRTWPKPGAPPPPPNLSRPGVGVMRMWLRLPGEMRSISSPTQSVGGGAIQCAPKKTHTPPPSRLFGGTEGENPLPPFIPFIQKIDGRGPEKNNSFTSRHDTEGEGRAVLQCTPKKKHIEEIR